jgi:hypothetical protein
MHAIGGPFEAISFLVCFLNTLSTASIIYWYAALLTRFPILVSLVYLFNGGWAALHAFSKPDCRTGDLVHDICFRAFVPMRQILGYFLSFSKTDSYAIPLSIATIAFVPMQRGWRICTFTGFLAALTPNTAASAAAFAFGSCFSSGFLYFIPFALFLVPRLSSLALRAYPLWREYQMAGAFFAPIVSWWDMLGPLFFGMIPTYRSQALVWVHRMLAYMAVFLLLELFRFGHDQSDNILAICGVAMPFLAVNFMEVVSQLWLSRSRSVAKGVAQSLLGAVFVVGVAGGALGILSLHRKSVGISTVAWDAGEWIRRNVEKGEVIIANAEALVPATVVAGRQIFCGEIGALWRRGANLRFGLQMVRHIERTGQVARSMSQLGVNLMFTRKGTRLEEVAAADPKLIVVYLNEAWTLYRLNGSATV